MALLYLIIRCRPLFLSKLYVLSESVTHGFLLNCPNLKMGGGGCVLPPPRSPTPTDTSIPGTAVIGVGSENYLHFSQICPT